MYSRTQNENGTFNTRCLYCFLTVASAVETPEQLDRLEAEHICLERLLVKMAGCGCRERLPRAS